LPLFSELGEAEIKLYTARDENAAGLMASAAAIARGGVSHLVIPFDLWEKETSARVRQYPVHLKERPPVRQKKIDRVVAALEAANRPLIIYGRGAKGSSEDLKELAEKLGAPLVNSLPAAGIFSYQVSLVMGGLGNTGGEEVLQLLSASDLILIFGATWWPEKIFA
ncbi:MAG: hypothetical protein ACOC5A_04075, partial [Halanaerobiales bacterium]